MSAGAGAFLFTALSKLALGPTQPPRKWVAGAPSPVVNRPGCKSDHSPLSSAEFKKTWIYTSTPPYFMAWLSAGTLHLPSIRNALCFPISNPE